MIWRPPRSTRTYTLLPCLTLFLSSLPHPRGSPTQRPMPMPAQPDFAALSLDAIAAFARDRRLPPVDRWHPAHCGDSEMRIAADGTWFHQGSPITRPELVRLFSDRKSTRLNSSH